MAKRLQSTKFAGVEKGRSNKEVAKLFGIPPNTLSNWKKESIRTENVPISGNLIKKKALYFSKKLSLEKFQASDGWLDKWKKGFGISFKTISGEAKSVTGEITASWLATALPTLLSRYPSQNIFNADEFGLFY
ncbi:tigger transposable element-derived protein 4-like [Hydractinia symbiolongicarpus]|uniref:tigger transposable element-derived protein 4-like n=1 Tax=Hydractinia symbiolongicarpus TaxID=13093 RepID=UPI00254D25B7|nr:tigger transposable element-derived protein 4-like [Hydractinia symbiolongicarpus]